MIVNISNAITESLFFGQFHIKMFWRIQGVRKNYRSGKTQGIQKNVFLFHYVHSLPKIFKQRNNTACLTCFCFFFAFVFFFVLFFVCFFVFVFFIFDTTPFSYKISRGHFSKIIVPLKFPKNFFLQMWSELAKSLKLIS